VKIYLYKTETGIDWAHIGTKDDIEIDINYSDFKILESWTEVEDGN
jgi:hypothetical protein